MRARIVAALPRLRRFCQAMTGNADDGDDLMQATVERALARSDQFDPQTRLDSWLFRIAQNLHIDAVRRTRRRGAHLPDDELLHMAGEDGRTLVENRSELAVAQHALQQLPEDQRAVFVLVVVEGQGYREVAETLGIPIGTVMSRLARARSRIGDVLGRRAVA
jgi:RNA polymerase sigma-70 factor (ECF subfamily)